MDLGLLAGTGWASGLNVYAVTLILGLVGRFGEVAAIPDQLSSTPVLIGSGVLYIVEFFADKVPYLDNAWDAIHTVVRPALAGWLGFLLAGEAGVSDWVGASTSGLLALASHSAKATTRAAVNVSPEPVSNIGLSLFEDGIVAAMVALAIANPALALVVVIILAVAGVALVVWLWRAISRVWAVLAQKTRAPNTT